MLDAGLGHVVLVVISNSEKQLVKLTASFDKSL